jgi:phospholipase/lecithinase/hemolysin
MIATWSRRAALIAAGAVLSLLAGCGASTTVSGLTPTRIISFGDAFSDVGQQAGMKYTLNDGSVNNWVNTFANSFGLSVTPSNVGGTGYAQGLARVNTSTNAAGKLGTPSVSQQIDAFLAVDNFGPNDVVLIAGGVGDIVAEINSVNAGIQTTTQMQTNVQQAGRDLAALVVRLVASGAKYVAVTGTYNLGQTPWATATGNNTLLTSTSTLFNDAMLVPIVSMGKNVLYVDATYYLNLVSNPLSAPAYGLTNATTPVCTSIDYGTGIGLGTGQVNSLLCTPYTLVSGANPAQYAFADEIYFTPVVQRLFGSYAYSRVRSRW